MRRALKTGAIDDSATAVREALASGAEEVVVVHDGTALTSAALRALRGLTRVRLRATIATFDEALHARLGLPGTPRAIVGDVARAAAIGLPVDVVLPLAEELGPVAGRLHGLARAAPKITRHLLDLLPSGLTPRAPSSLAEEREAARAAADELGLSLDTDDDTRVDTELHALLAGIKPVIRLSVSGDPGGPGDARSRAEEEAALHARYARFGLVTAAADGLFIDDDGDHERKLRLVYVARTREIAERVREVEAKTFAPKTSVESRAREYRDLGVALGYPRCCVDAYVERVVVAPGRALAGGAVSEPLAEAYLAAAGAREAAPSWRLNHLLFECGDALVTFTPCSYRCAAALAYADAVLARVEAEAPLAAARLVERLAVELAVDRRGARVLVTRDANGALVGAAPRRAPSGGLVHPLDEALARRLLAGVPDEPAPIFLSFAARDPSTERAS